MLGELVIEERGKVTGMRVLPSEGQGPRVEVSFRATGKIMGIEQTDMGTYVSIMRPDGTLFGEGQGIVTTKDGDTAAWSGQGVGRRTQSGGTTFRGAIYFQSNSSKLARLNGVAVVFEYESDGEGNTSAKDWEWR